ncbi:MAG: aspartate aminotransferase family protein [Proteobacteria bacterium]|nr:aspartate aminotransferase family protein [Pseudomonadota bacterium]MBI3499348.1 aspartate aminotransferase family protein [Pseudomonadota bacterium]
MSTIATQAAARNIDLDSALTDARALFVKRNPNSGAIYQEALGALPGGNTRTVLFYAPYPLTMSKGDGAYLWDADGHKYADFLGEYTAGLYGHSHPVIRKALDQALDGGISFGSHNAMEGKLAKLVQARFPSVELLRFTNSGTEANLMAITVALVYTGRSKVMVFEGGYHGGVFTFQTGQSPVNGPFNFVIAPTYNDIPGTIALIEKHAKELAVVAIEPMQGGGGCIPASPAFLSALREATTKHGVVLLFDEVMTSRLSPGGLQALYNVIPDMTSLGKYIGGGMSFGAFGGRADIMSRFDPRRPDALPHAGTFNNNILTMSAGYAGLSEVYTPQRAVELNAFGDKLRQRLNALCRKRDLAMQFTGIGSMMSVHFLKGEIRSIFDARAGSKELVELFFLDMLERGIYLARRGMMALSLPITETDGEALVAAVDEFQTARGSLLK